MGHSAMLEEHSCHPWNWVQNAIVSGSDLGTSGPILDHFRPISIRHRITNNSYKKIYAV